MSKPNISYVREHGPLLFRNRVEGHGESGGMPSLYRLLEDSDVGGRVARESDDPVILYYRHYRRVSNVL